MIKEYLEIGEIVGTHGVHGELRLNPWCDSPDFVSRFKTLYYDSNGGCAAQIKSARPHGNIVLLRIAGIDSVEQAQKMRGKILYMKRSDAKLPEEYAYGMKLVDKGPSAVNRRPVKFRYENGVLSGYVDEPYSDKSVDFGIAKLHFLIGVKSKGINGKWNFDNVFEQTQSQRIKFESKNEEENDNE